MTNNTKYSTPGHLSSETLLKYHRMLLSVEEKQRVESHLKECEFCSDALNGMGEMTDARNITKISHELGLRIRNRLKIKRKIFSSHDFLTIALVMFILGLLTLITFYFIFMKW